MLHFHVQSAHCGETDVKVVVSCLKRFSICFRVAAESNNKENEDPDYDNLHSDDSSSDEEVLYDDRFSKLLLM